MSTLLALRDIESGRTEYLDQTSGHVFSDEGGLNLVREMSPTEYVVGERGQPIRVNGEMVHVQRLSHAANAYLASQVASLTGAPRVKYGMRSEDGQLVAMDLGLPDVHTNATLPNYAAGYHIAEGVADIASPVVMVPKASDVYYTWNATTDFNRKLGTASSPGGAVGEVNPGLAPSTYTTVEYALGGYLPTEIQSNADTPLRPFTKLVQMIVDAQRLEREYRVATLLETSGSWNANLVTTIAAGAQWDGGASSDPVANLHKAIEQSYMPITGIVWSELVEHDFLRNPGVQKFFTFKDQIDGLPDPGKLSSTLHLPPIFTAKMKYLTGGGVLTYVWGNHVVLLRQPPEQPPTSQMDVASSYTMRWNGGTAPDGTMTGGLLVRTFYDPKRGPRGGTQVVTVLNDSEQMTSGLVGGLLLNAHQ